MDKKINWWEEMEALRFGLESGLIEQLHGVNFHKDENITKSNEKNDTPNQQK